MNNWRKKSLVKSEVGLGLIEILVAITLLMIIVSSFGNIISNAMIISQSSKLENTGLALAQDKMEEIKAAWPKAIVDLDSKVTSGRDADEQLQYNGTTFHRVWSATSVDSVTYNDPTPPDPSNPTALYPKYLLRVIVTVSWDQPGKSGTIHKSTSVLSYITGR